MIKAGSGRAEDCIIMRLLYTFILVACITACSHPLEIVGQGDINSSTGANDCSLEAQPCKNYAVGDYEVTYSGMLTIELSVSNITPTNVRLYPKGLDGGWVELDTEAPFSFSIDATEFEPGNHEMLVTADDGAIYLSEKKIIAVSGCNADHDLCSRRFDQVRYATTHNAMSNAANGWFGPNQNLDVPAQLAAGVRGLMLDTYRAGYINLLGQAQVPEADPDAAYLYSITS